MPAEYEAPDASYAELVHRANQECAAQSARLKGASADQAFAIAVAFAETQAARMEALLVLFRHRDPRIPDLQLSLLDDPDQDIWRSTFSSYSTDSPQLRSALHSKLLSSDPETASCAAMMLARFHDETILPTIEDWLNRADRGWRNVALGALAHSKIPAADKILRTLWTEGWGDQEDRMALALELTGAGCNEALQYVTTIANTATSAWSVACATQVYLLNPRAGLKLMRHICDSGDLEAKQFMVGQISSLGGHLPHRYTYDGLAEARNWVEQQLDSLDDCQSVTVIDT